MSKALGEPEKYVFSILHRVGSLTLLPCVSLCLSPSSDKLGNSHINTRCQQLETEQERQRLIKTGGSRGNGKGKSE